MVKFNVWIVCQLYYNLILIINYKHISIAVEKVIEVLWCKVICYSEILLFKPATAFEIFRKNTGR